MRPAFSEPRWTVMAKEKRMEWSDGAAAIDMLKRVQWEKKGIGLPLLQKDIAILTFANYCQASQRNKLWGGGESTMCRAWKKASQSWQHYLHFFPKQLAGKPPAVE